MEYLAEIDENLLDSSQIDLFNILDDSIENQLDYLFPESPQTENQVYCENVHANYSTDPSQEQLITELLNNDYKNEQRECVANSLDKPRSLELSPTFDERDANKRFIKELKKMTKNSAKSNKRKKADIHQRKIAHASAELRYRCSINAQIDRLKTLVAGSNANWKKSTILATVGDYIEKVKTMNEKLVEENLQLKMRLSQTISAQLNPVQSNMSYVILPNFSHIAISPQLSNPMFAYI